MNAFFAPFFAPFFALGTLVSVSAFADAPDVKTPAPNIHLIDNLDEADNLGWCIDTVGRGFADKLHAHSCKPRGGDVQFMYVDPQIRSATFGNKCATAGEKSANGIKLDLLDCEPDNKAQKFLFEPLTGRKNKPGQTAGTFFHGAEMELCLQVGLESRRAGPFMSRDLLLASCVEGLFSHTAWVIVEN